MMAAVKELLLTVADELNVDPYDDDGNLEPRVAAEVERRIQHPAEIALGLAFLQSDYQGG